MSKFFSDNNKSLLQRIAEINQIDPESIQTDADVVAEYVIEKEHRDNFSMSRGFQSKGIRTLVCKLCGGEEFIVGQDAYFTAIKCPRCGYELGIHEG